MQLALKEYSIKELLNIMQFFDSRLRLEGFTLNCITEKLWSPDSLEDLKIPLID